ncbi:regulator of G-protein signaling 14 isoform X3 [Protopterus annectens]|uniref:regulator of G-protein signaling 14 isoform X3 n=1 Tax=Protopterus annectens TaxID=7888 RepID=UPI001CFC0D70|nr:regulator of G-protein signaling 14 isoform X3 [Protopterus annectens]
MSGKMKYLGVQNGRLVQAVSDGELTTTESTDARGSNQSLNSLSTTQNTGKSNERPIASWAVSFERLLQDPVGVKYFTEFLKKEYSAENILFWLACERFRQIPEDDTQQLFTEARKIYDSFLSSSASSPINVDKQARMSEEALCTPKPNMFEVQQLQIFNLMKFDSYTRFVKSKQYQDCVLLEVAGQPLPGMSPKLQDQGAAVSTRESSSSFDSKKQRKLKAGKSLPAGADMEWKGITMDKDINKNINKSGKTTDKCGSCGELLESNNVLQLRRESQGSLNSAASLELAFLPSLSSKSENETTNARSNTEQENKSIKYCCVYLPDGTASLAKVQPSFTIRDMLSGICEKRGIDLADVKVYLMENEKKPLMLDQESIVLMDREIRLENRITFEVAITHIKKTVKITAKPSKTLREALQPSFEKYNVKPKTAILRITGESKSLDLNSAVSLVANQKLMLDLTEAPKETEHINSAGHSCSSPGKTDPIKKCIFHDHEGEAANIVPEMPTFSQQNTKAKAAGVNPHRRTYEMEELLNRAQKCRADDQRGLLSKDSLVLPEFLLLPEDKDEGYSETYEETNEPPEPEMEVMASAQITEHNIEATEWKLKRDSCEHCLETLPQVIQPSSDCTTSLKLHDIVHTQVSRNSSHPGNGEKNTQGEVLCCPSSKPAPSCCKDQTALPATDEHARAGWVEDRVQNKCSTNELSTVNIQTRGISVQQNPGNTKAAGNESATSIESA